jgi:hypothetical protein
MIKTYGLHWKLDKVMWGRPNNAGTLFGATTRSRNADPVDFREQRGIYVLYSNYEVVYIGQTGSGNDRLFKRLKMHKSDHLSERWDRFSWFGTQRVLGSGKLSTDTAGLHTDTGVALNLLEAIAIATSEPRLNLQRGKWGDSIQYFQYFEDGDEEEDDDQN